MFGPRGTGKTSWLQTHFPLAFRVDFLHEDTFLQLQASPSRLEGLLPSGFKDWVVLDEVQRIPAILNEVHRLIEAKKLRFALTGSSARKLRKQGANLLAGRAITESFFPLTAQELGSDFSLSRSLQTGHLPLAVQSEDPRAFLRSYVATYLREEIMQEGLVRNLGAFARFLEAASFSQAQYLNVSAVAHESSVERKVVEDYFQVLEDLLIGVRLPVFAKRAKRKTTKHPKFFFFDCGVYRAIRPQGPLDSHSEIDGPGLETLVLQELRALNSYLRWDYQIFCWRTAGAAPDEVDFVLYGSRGLHAIEVKRSARITAADLKGLLAFKKEYSLARLMLLYGGTREYSEQGVEILPIEQAVAQFHELF